MKFYIRIKAMTSISKKMAMTSEGLASKIEKEFA
jgi:hypothetical protein